MWTREDVECYNQGTAEHTWDLEDQNANSNIASKDCIGEDCDEKKDSAGDWNKNHLYYCMTKNLSPLSQYPDNLSEFHVKGEGSPYLASGLKGGIVVLKTAECFKPGLQ